MLLIPTWETRPYAPSQAQLTLFKSSFQASWLQKVQQGEDKQHLPTNPLPKCTDPFQASMSFLHPKTFHLPRTRAQHRAKIIFSPSLVENKPCGWSGLPCSQLCFGSYKEKTLRGYVFPANSSRLVLTGGTTNFYATPKRQGNLLLPREELSHRAGGGWCSLCFFLLPIVSSTFLSLAGEQRRS